MRVGKRRWIERCGCDDCAVDLVGNGAFNRDEAKWLYDGCMGVLRNRQNEAVGWLRRLALVVVTVVVLCPIAIVVSVASSNMVLGSRSLLEEVVHSMGCGRYQKKSESGDNRQI